MAKRGLRLVKWIDDAPSLGICESCNAQFPAPSYLHGQREPAEAAIRSAFDKHNCKPEDTGQAAARSVREATRSRPYLHWPAPRGLSGQRAYGIRCIVFHQGSRYFCSRKFTTAWGRSWVSVGTLRRSDPHDRPRSCLASNCSYPSLETVRTKTAQLFCRQVGPFELICSAMLRWRSYTPAGPR
jgi:hypothetical protein